MKKLFKIIILPTEKVTIGCILRDGNNNKLLPLLGICTNPDFTAKTIKGNHLYIISDDEIKEGDWFLHSTPDLCWSNPNICEKIDGNYVEGNFVFGMQGETTGCKKIVATTDTLIIPEESKFSSAVHFIPKIHESYLPTYIKAFNEGKQITEVYLEREPKIQKLATGEEGITGSESEYNLKIKTREDNTVIISNETDSNLMDKLYSREDM